jgi:hypothetical protein
MRWRGKSIIFGFVAFLVAAVPLFAALPAQAATGDGAIQVYLHAPGGVLRTNLIVSARRQGTDAAPRDVGLRILLNDNFYSSGPIAQTNNPGACGGADARNFLFDIAVTDYNHGNVVVGGQNAVLVCGQTGSSNTKIVRVDIDVPADPGPGGTPTPGSGATYLHGTVTTPDGKPAPHVTITITDNNGTTYGDIKPQADGTYLVPVIDTGTYSVKVKGFTGEPPNGVNVDLQQDNVKIINGENVLNLVVGDDLIIKEDPDCNAGSLNWLICNPIRFALNIIDWIRDKVLVPFLVEQPLNPTGGDDYSKTVYGVWNGVRNLANVAFILIFFLVIIGTAIGYDNYTIKKVLPRAVAAAILIQLSFLISSLIIDLGNVLGQGVGLLGTSIIPTPKIDFSQSWSAKGIFLGGSLLGVAGGVSAVIGISAASIGALLLSMIMLFFTLVIRKVLILALVVAAPIAFVLWVLPNTERYYKEWFSSLVRLSLMYPMIIALFEAGRLFSKAAELSNDGSFGPAALTPLFVIAGYAVPIFLVPVTFVAAGRLMSASRKGIQKLSGSIDPRKTTAAQNRAANRKYKSAVIARDPSFGAVRRAIASKRGGFGWRPGPSGRQEMEKIADSGINERAQAQAQAADQATYGRQSVSSKDSINRKAAALQDAMLDQQVASASHSRTASGQTIRTADLSDEGIQELVQIIQAALAGGKHATAIAAMQRLGTTKEGVQALHELRTQDFGGTDGALVGDGMTAEQRDKYTTTWDKGIKGAVGGDLRKPPAAAYNNISPQEFAKMSSEEATRALDYFHRSINAQVPAGATPDQAADIERRRQSATSAAARFSTSVQKALDNSNVRDTIAPDTVTVVRQAGTTHPGVL